MTRIDFWYEFASTYSYPSAMRIETLARDRGVELRWRPFLLGPIFAEQGWRDSPFNIFPAKGRYMWRDMERVCARQGLALKKPDPFPQNTVLAARVAVSLPDALRPDFSRAVYTAEFADGRPVADRAVIADILASLGVDPSPAIEHAQSAPVKQRLRMESDEARRLGLFGAPSFVTDDGEIFWGNDRLEQALDWATGEF